MWGAIAFLILFIFFIWRHAIRAAVLPVEALTDYIEKMSPNDLSYDHKSTGPKEIRELNTSFSILVHEMIKHKKKLEISNADLKLAIQSAKTANRENEEKSQFLANVSHELRTPITSLIGFASIVKKHLEKSIGPALDPENEKALKKLRVSETNIEIIINEGKRLSFLVTDLLDVAKLGAGKIKWNIQSRNLEEIVTEAIKSTQSLFDQGHVKLKKYIPDHLPLVLADKYRIQQVIVNLISNAAKFTHEGSITVTVQSDNDHATVQIKDTGIGIPEKHIKSIFEKFHQVGGDNYVDKPVGTGLGLAICQDIIQHHNGEIWCTSTLGEGSTFCFTIPLHKPSFDAIDAELQCNKLA
ncbi:MAG: hypothetical protein CMO81_08330 [Waddliaceae bacterium]|nr:hypothetical protein [Waddliaceae bacterium]